VLAIQEFVANGGGRPWSAPPQCCIAGADGQSWPCRSAWLVAFRSSRLDDRFEGVPRVPDRTKCEHVARGAARGPIALIAEADRPLDRRPGVVPGSSDCRRWPGCRSANATETATRVGSALADLELAPALAADAGARVLGQRPRGAADGEKLREREP
jgi:hypothetical protein